MFVNQYESTADAEPEPQRRTRNQPDTVSSQKNRFRAWGDSQIQCQSRPQRDEEKAKNKGRKKKELLNGIFTRE